MNADKQSDNAIIFPPMCFLFAVHVHFYRHMIKDNQVSLPKYRLLPTDTVEITFIRL